MKNKIELLAPAGDIERGKIAINFGADAIYLGAQLFSLRSRASNFTYKNLHEICKLVHKQKKRIYLVTNIFCHNNDTNEFENFIKKIKNFGIDAYICSDPFIIELIKKNITNAEIHISTQQTISNSKAALFFKRNGASRIVFSRETTFSELKETIANVKNKIELEIFIHGAVCIAFSGRCMLSNNFCYRDANTGGCAQSCRWPLNLLNEKQELIAKNFTMSAKDMCQMKNIYKIIDSGITSLKIEGRMKSEYYIATVVNAYRRAIDSYYKKKKLNKEYVTEILKAANREVSTAWFDGKPGQDKMLYHDEQKKVAQNYALIITKKISKNKYEAITKNYISKKMSFEVISTKLTKIRKIKIVKISTESNDNAEIVNTPMSKITIELNENLNLCKNDIFRII